MNILALDIATKTGYAINGPNKLVAGTKLLASVKELKRNKMLRFDRRIDVRAVSFFIWLTEMVNAWNPDIVVFEDIRFASSQAQAHLWGSLRGVVWSVCAADPKIRVDCLDTGKLKIWATGSGTADKGGMAWALIEKEPNEFTMFKSGFWQISAGRYLDDNAVDAIHLLRWAQSIYGK